jgi:hypothetical protein
MAESLKDLIAKLKSQQQQNSQQVTNKPIEKPVPVPMPSQVDEDEDYVGEDEEEIKETPQVVQKHAQKPSQEEMGDIQKVMLLQDNGIYRASMLDQMEKMNRSLMIIAGVLAELSGGHVGGK